MNNESQESNSELNLSHFIRIEATSGNLIKGNYTPDELSEIRQRHQSSGSISLSAQLEIAWLNGDDETVREICKLQDSVKGIIK